MISVEEAIRRIVAGFSPVAAETVPIADAASRVLAEDMSARLDQPPSPASSMDGYAVRAADAVAGRSLRVIGASPAGDPFGGTLNAGEAVRIFTGGVVPAGADAVVIQEDTEAKGDAVHIRESAHAGKHIRAAGLDFRKGDVLAAAGKRLTPRDLALLAAGDIAQVAVRRHPQIAFVATGDELSRPGEARKPGGIVASSGYGLAAMIAAWGGAPRDLGILPDTAEAIAGLPALAHGADLIVTLGGASVGDHDLVQRALGPQGFVLDFWKIAMRPGKPLIFGRLGATPLLGLPGNPVSTLVCAMLFLKPAIAAMLGVPRLADVRSARLAKDLPANDDRQDYLRARLLVRDGELWVEPFAVQDSSMLGTLARADALVVRAPGAPAAKAGERAAFLGVE
ncbi:MAG TPA: gephyrin-like molybdotransferase Glp [Rhizomicrobium sp.]|nr:gephyrin-like molybdotransferase Glp [Rhizomicrobium sp.]